MALNDLLKQINKRYGDACMVQASTSETLAKKNRIPTGILSFDIGLGGGVPTGSIITLRGEYSSGKSALSHRIGAAFQRHCRNCGNPMIAWEESIQDGAEVQCCDNPESMRVVWFDAEGSFQNDWATRLGMSMDNTYVIRTEFAEQGIDVADLAIRSGECDLLVVDSVAALTPSVEIEESAEKWQMGTQARLMNKAMRKWVSAQNSDSLKTAIRPTILLINQIRMKIGVIYGSPETSPGGKGIEFASSVICKVKRKGYLEDTNGGVPYGQSMEILFQKNKTAPPNRSVLFDLHFRENGNYFAGSTNIAEQLIYFAEHWGLVERKGSWFEIGDKKVQGAKGASQLLIEDQELFGRLYDEVWNREIGWIQGS